MRILASLLFLHDSAPSRHLQLHHPNIARADRM
jgi:hypothetical protein